jgi:phenylacetate-coenzyme A ligase PaaK-like adenylate-forming protein
VSRLRQAATLARLRREQRVRAGVGVDERLRRLVTHAASRSPHWRRALRGLEGAPLHELPVLTKDDLVERFDEVVTDHELRRDDLEAFVRSSAGGRFGRYRVAVSSGSTGRPGIVAFDPQEWAGLLAASASARRIAGSPGGRSAKVGSPSPWHLSSQLGATLQDPRRPALRLPVTTPLPTLVTELERFRPDLLTAYPSVLAELAGEVAVAPRHVFGGGEVFTGATRRRVREAWGAEPFDQYMTTEAGAVAGECPAHEGMHVLGDHVLVEVVDGSRQPVGPGVFGDAVLVTVLSSRTVPLLRYELRDQACLAPGECPCGRAGPRIAAIAGRERDVLRIGTTRVHPSVLTGVLDTAAVARWQVVQRGDDVRVLVTGPAPTFDPASLRAAVAGALPAGATVTVEVVARLSAPAGKASLFDVGP